MGGREGGGEREREIEREERREEPERERVGAGRRRGDGVYRRTAERYREERRNWRFIRLACQR